MPGQDWSLFQITSFQLTSMKTLSSLVSWILGGDDGTVSHRSLNVDFIPAAMYKSISRKHFSIEKYFSDPKDGSVAMLQNHGINGTLVNGKMLGTGSWAVTKCALKNQDIIGIVYKTKDKQLIHCDAFKFSLLDSAKVSENDTYPTLIESSNSKQNVDFFSDESVELISDIKGSRTPSKKRKRQSTK